MTGGLNNFLEILDVSVEIGGKLAKLALKAVDGIDHDMILGMNFINEFDMCGKLANGLWRAGDGEWMTFTERTEGPAKLVYAECAGISALDEDERERVDELMKRVLASATRAPGLTDLTEHHVYLTDPTPIKEKTRRMSPKMLAIAQDEGTRMYGEGIIERSTGDFSSASMILRKSDGTHRPCTDYRALNKVTKKDAYHLPIWTGSWINYAEPNICRRSI